MKVCIERNQNQFFVYQMNEQAMGQSSQIAEYPQEGANMAESTQGPGMGENKQQARNLDEALMLAGRMLSQAGPDESDQMFQEGLGSVLPTE